MVFLLVAAVIGLISLIGVEIYNAFGDFIDFLIKKFGDLPNFFDKAEIWAAEKIAFLPDSAEATVNGYISSAIDSIKGFLTSAPEKAREAAAAQTDTADAFSAFKNIDLSAITSSISGVWATAKQIPSIFIATVVSVFACCFMAADYDRITDFIKRQFLKNNENFAKAKHIVTSSLKNLIKAYVLIILVTFCEVALGLGLLKLIGVYKGSWIIFIAMGTAIVDIFPILGTGTILIPWSVYSFISGDIPMGIGIFILYVFITVMRQFIEPKLVAGQLGLPPFVTIIGMYIGLKLFGIIGMLAVPLAIILIKLLNDEGIIHVWKTGNEPEENGGKEDENIEKV